ncbi:unnamed protein product [Discula destructiva]
MKTSFVSLLTLAVGALAGRSTSFRSVAVRDQAISASTLTQTVMTYTSSINGTVATLVENPTVAQHTAAIKALTPQLEDVSDLLHSAVKIAVTPAFLDINGTDLIPTVEGLVHELVFTVDGVVAKLGSDDGLLVVLKPLFAVLGSLVTSLDTVVEGLLDDVEGILGSAGVLSPVTGVLSSLI